MNVPRFYLSDQGLILETPLPLSPMQREASRRFALEEYSRRYKTSSGHTKEQLGNVIKALRNNDFLERAVPQYDFDKEVIIYG